MMDFYGNIEDPVMQSKKRLAVIEPADERPSCTEMSCVPEGDHFKLRMRVASLGALVATARGNPATGTIEIVGLALSAKELQQ